jgi:hypothetical protein
MQEHGAAGLRGQSIHMGRLGLRMAADDSDPVVEIIYFNQEHIRFLSADRLNE